MPSSKKINLSNTIFSSKIQPIFQLIAYAELRSLKKIICNIHIFSKSLDKQEAHEPCTSPESISKQLTSWSKRYDYRSRLVKMFYYSTMRKIVIFDLKQKLEFLSLKAALWKVW